MEILGGLSQPVSFYTKNTGNSVNTAISDENISYSSNIFAPNIYETKKPDNSKLKRKKNNKRLNINDSEYLPDEATETVAENEDENNFFINPEEKKISTNIKKAIDHFFSTTPLLNYFYLRRRSRQIGNTIRRLNDINQDVDDIVTTSIPYGEADTMYNDMAKSLRNAAEILAESKKNL